MPQLSKGGKYVFGWSRILPPHTREIYNVKPGDDLLSIRSSNIAIGLAIKGPIIEEARKHPEIKVFE
jgi:hypothetical protein